jgi:hypothetical protein
VRSPILRGSAIPFNQAAVLQLERRFEPPLHIEQDPALVGVVSYRFQDEVPRDGVEERPDVDIEHPVVAPTALAAHPQRVVRRTAGPIAVGVLVEHRLHAGFQVPAHDRLGDPVRDSRHPEHPRAAVPLRYLHRTHRRREIRPRRQPIPELVQVPVKVPFELPDRLLVNAGAALVGLDPPIGLPNGPLGDLKRLQLRLAHPAPPARRRLTSKPARTTRPLRSSPITGPSPLLRDGPPLCPARYSTPRSSRCSEVSLPRSDRGPKTAPLAARGRGATGSNVPHKSPDHARATFMPDTTWPVSRHPPGSSRSNNSTPVSMPSIRFRHVISGSLALAFVIHT